MPMYKYFLVVATMHAFLAALYTCAASQLTVTPIVLELNAPSAAGTLKLHNDENVEVVVQTRIFRWSQIDGKESLLDTTDVVASPPIITLHPHSDYTVRIVRLLKNPVRGEEGYRIMIDQLPNWRNQPTGRINVLIRQFIPVFFREQQVIVPNVDFFINHTGQSLLVVAKNSGDEHMRIASLHLHDSSGETISFGNGLLGYVLGRSSMSWRTSWPSSRFGPNRSFFITAETNKGPIRATATFDSRI
jgi:fimbrial chaperone protein